MTFGERVIGALKLDANTFEDIERDPSAIGQSVGVIVLAAVSTAVGWIWYGGLTGIFTGIISSLIGYAIWSLVIWLVGTKVMPEPATKADFPEVFRVIAFAAAPLVLGAATIVPLLGWLILLVLYLWSIAAMVVAVRQVLDYTDTFKAAIVVVIGFVAYLVISVLLGSLLLGGRMMGGALGY